MRNLLRWLAAIFTLIFVLLASLHEARADILFINMNGGATEIPAVQAIARQNNERVYILPKKPASEYEERYNTDSLVAEILELAKQGVRPRTLVVSGHHSRNEGFWGDNGEASMYYIAALLPQKNKSGYQEARDFFSSIQSVYLWGCYTGQLNNIYRLLNGENAAYTNVKYAVGFGEKGPLNTDPLSGRMLQDVLSKERQFRTGSNEDMLALLKTIPAYKQKDLLIHRGTTFVGQAGVMTQENFIRACSEPSRKENLKEAIQLIWNYYWNERGPIPENTSKSELRSAYEELQRNSFCMQMGAVDLSKEFKEVPKPANIVRLIFYKNVISNFARIYAGYLQHAQLELQANGLGDASFLPRVDKIPRGEVMKKLEELHARIEARFSGKSDPEKVAMREYFTAMIEDIEEVVYPNGEYIPLRWIDAGSNDWGGFEVFANFEEAKAKARKKAGAIP